MPPELLIESDSFTDKVKITKNIFSKLFFRVIYTVYLLFFGYIFI